MKPLQLFLNERSCDFSDDHVDDLLMGLYAVLRSVKKIRDDTTLSCHENIFKLTFGNSARTIASVFSSHREKLQFIKALVNANPWPNFYKDVEYDICFNDTPCIAFIGAYKDQSIVTSFDFEPWNNAELNATKVYLVDEVLEEENVTIPNISNKIHTVNWIQEIRDHGFNVAASSILKEFDGYVVRMWLNDHEPPHIHVQRRSQPNWTLAKINIENFDILEEKEKVRETNNLVKPWLKEKKDELMSSWNRCRSGQLPLAID